MLASLVPVGSVPSSGNGIGAVSSVVTFQNTGTEFGCVGSVGGSQATGSAQCFGVSPPGGITHEQTGSGNNIYTASDLGFTSSGANTLANLLLVLNGNEGGGANAAFTLEALALNLFTPTGTLLGTFATTSQFAAVDFPGAGNAGFGFQLDATQAAQANALLAANPNLVIGASAAISGANAGPDTVSITRINTVQPTVNDPTGVPEPSSVLLIGAGLAGFGLFRRRNSV